MKHTFFHKLLYTVILSMMISVLFADDGYTNYRSFNVYPLEHDFHSNVEKELEVHFNFNYLRDSTSSSVPIVLVPESHISIDNRETVLSFNQTFRTIHKFEMNIPKVYFEKRVKIEVLHGETNHLLDTFHLTILPPKLFWIKIALFIGLGLVILFISIYYFLNSKS